ncbi:MAG: type IV pili methyl-accepting chemotaxis transducer N-terminal domain-containing protein [Gammaproteobacteria bacterium]|nr:type IV pili methyl-accepting chemotaxis transducer N-terminal domain-containing protein [Gammaproteobacteria bacterium]
MSISCVSNMVWRSTLMVCVAAIFAATAHAAVPLATAVNKAGQQRMLSQRIAKAYLMAAADVNVQEANKQLDESIGLFEQNQQLLLEFASNSTIKEKVQAVSTLWDEVKITAVSKVSEEKAKRFIAQTDELLSRSQAVVDELAQLGGNASKIIATSGMQRMLSQRLVKYYVAYYYGIRDPAIADEFIKSRDRYDANHRVLLGYSGNSADLTEKLKKVSMQWEYAKRGLENFQDTATMKPFIVSVTMENILKKMDEITSVYEAL